MGQGEERRRAGAARTEMVLKVEYDQPTDLLADYLTNLSQGGLFICTSVPFEVGQEISFSVSFPGLLEPIELTGIVRWRRDGADACDGKPGGVGVEFGATSEKHRVKIDQLIERCKATAAPAAGVDSRVFRVLLVEDNVFTHDLFKHAVTRFHADLNQAGALDILSAVDGQQAILMLEKTPVDLAIIDYFLPVMNGSDVIRKMRQIPSVKKTPVMVISVGGDGVREDALMAGADLYVDKPIMLKQLLNTLHVLLFSQPSS